MSTATASPANTQRLVMGTLKAPITATKVYQKPQPHDFGGKKAISWVVFTTEGKMIKATTYDGALGKGFNLGEHNTKDIPAPETKALRQAIKGYSEVANGTELPAFITLA